MDENKLDLNTNDSGIKAKIQQILWKKTRIN